MSNPISREEKFEANREGWDEMTLVHIESEFYDVAGFLKGNSSLHDFEPDELGSVDGCSLLHLQCHFGLDTLSWARRGARVTGVDFSPNSIAAAKSLAERAGIEASFIEGNVYNAREMFPTPFDVVYTGIGALNWLPDIPEWARVVSSLIKPGGRFYLLEIHPILSMLDDEDIVFNPAWPYFHNPSGIEFEDDGDYADPSAKLTKRKMFEWSHHLGEVVSSLLDQGLELKFLHEHDVLAYKPWPFLEQTAPGTTRFKVPEGKPKIPLEYSLLATKPGGG